ncbi:unnamed protein product, partial [Ectocarpus fasciculatus]
ARKSAGGDSSSAASRGRWPSASDQKDNLLRSSESEDQSRFQLSARVSCSLSLLPSPPVASSGDSSSSCTTKPSPPVLRRNAFPGIVPAPRRSSAAAGPAPVVVGA